MVKVRVSPAAARRANKPLDNQITIYQSPDGLVNIEVLYADENIWLTQKLIARLFECSIDNVSLHLKNIFEEGELDLDSVIEEYSITAADGKSYLTTFYNYYNRVLTPFQFLL